ncbi:hypothetical protein XNW1_4300001 [Xenorhabdus nematophila str. Websteri]|nr:hypothetical protein XNW1_1160001 [Xenorhabdus nematophila str. Websteri]CEF32398.1 hypothetical protein XNW1_4300001 [Xenorhabdus nematophila str. Websteri]
MLEFVIIIQDKFILCQPNENSWFYLVMIYFFMISLVIIFVINLIRFI